MNQDIERYVDQVVQSPVQVPVAGHIGNIVPNEEQVSTDASERIDQRRYNSPSRVEDGLCTKLLLKAARNPVDKRCTERTQRVEDRLNDQDPVCE